ncbi:AbrB/MazE/SpoVT family DNA-binding domain-containing protein [Deinococcus murrayi]|uniref:AbrB/MazE/SpoVT family DNA-binding domain-containing protein n=1 Tax=Deinococcus murrayi TaxID=68910 RepID=UPI0005584907|nr:AbrB/MazE/SpoVT family DNA-binding domain-containing protein [Deinococcus murrayi]
MAETVKVGRAYRVVLPAEFRERHGLTEGETLTAELDGDRLILTPLRVRQQAIQAKYAGRFPGLLEEFITERHAAAERE